MTRAKRSKTPSPAGRRGWPRRLLVWSLVAIIWLSVAGAGAVVYYAHDLPDVDRAAKITRKPSVTLLARDGSVLASYGKLYGEAVELEGLPPVLAQAVMAVEDRRFYDHVGVDPVGLARAALANLRAGAIVQGGSTITQQLAKNLFLTPERTIKRKVQELILALWLEHRFNKQRILALYLNRVYLGAGTYGVDAAARRYFDKSAQEVNLYEAAMLAGLLKAPSRYNPASDPEAARRRARIVLDDMVEAGYITRAEAEQAVGHGGGGTAVAAWRGRYFADWALREVRSHVGYHSRDLIVRTTLDRDLQRMAAAELRRLLAEQGAARQAGQAALVMMTPRGAVRAMVGGRDYRDSQFNRATQALRQPGSAFKPFVYLAGIEAGLTVDRKIRDRPVEIGGWSPENFDGRYHGEVTVREAFARSLNSVAVRILRRVGADEVVETAHRLGITAELDARPSLALGAAEVSLLDLTGAYAVFANRGRGVFAHGIVEIRERDGRILYRRDGSGPGQVVAPQHLRAMTDLLRANVAWGTGKAADPGRPAAGKTGTSQDFRDAWFVGFTAELVTGVWIGNDDGEAMEDVTGGTLPAALWRRVTTKALADAPPRPLPGMEVQVAERDTGGGDDGGLIERILRSLGGGDGGAEARSRANGSGSGSGNGNADSIGQRGR